MLLLERLRELADRVPSIRDQLGTEEATKNGLVMPFLQALGYDVFNPLEVVPEFTADVGIKKGEKVDYAVMRDGKPAMLFECKTIGANLDAHSSQLFRYFGTTTARIGVLTDGVLYRFFSDLSVPNRMDLTPFMEINLECLEGRALAELSKLSKDGFDLGAIIEAGLAMKVRSDTKRFLAAELAEPSDDFVRFIADRIYDGRITQNVVDRFRPLILEAATEHVKVLVDQRLKAALGTNRGDGGGTEQEESSHQGPTRKRAAVDTTVEELECYFIVKALLRDEVDTDRITARDVQSYFGILLDDNNRKPICRLWLNGPNRFLGLFDAEKNEQKISIEEPDDIFEYADILRDSLRFALAM